MTSRGRSYELVVLRRRRMTSGPGKTPYVLRRHQAEALEAVEKARRSGSSRWWVTMPPGAGKTLVGTEVARLTGRRTIVFSPNTAIQTQWARTWDEYAGEPAGTDRSLSAGFSSLTYQSLAVFDDDDDEEPPASVLHRLHPNGLALIERMKTAGPILLVLDECHHLLEVWGDLLREVLDELPDAVVLGLTATPPSSMTRSQHEQTFALFGPILYEARTPALVKAGYLAPYAELALVVEPTAEEAEWLAGQAERFRELTTDLLSPAFGSTTFLTWISQRFVESTRNGEVTWAELVKGNPELTDAALRMHHAELLELPEGAVMHEEHRHGPTAADWMELISDWLTRCIEPRAQADAGDAAVIEAVRRTLPSIDYVWTKRGVRAGRGTVDRVLARSAAKQAAAAQVIAAEHRNLGARARALVLCDHERATAITRRRLADDASPDAAGSALGMLRTLLDDPTTAATSPLLVTGKTVAGAEETLAALRESVRRDDPALADQLVIEPGPVPQLTGPWNSGRWVGAATELFRTGGTRTLVGTRGLLGEGWDAPCVTTLVDLTTLTTATSVTQTRGRALRLDHDNPDKVALIWSPVCVFTGHVTGSNDWERFARKNRGRFTLDELGAVVDGVAGVDVTFSAFEPPPTAEFDAINARMLIRGEDRDRVRQDWLEAPAFEDVVRTVVRIRADHPSAPNIPDPVTRALPVPYQDRIRPRVNPTLPVLFLIPAIMGLVMQLWPLLAAGLALGALALLAVGRSRVAAGVRARPTMSAVAAVVADSMHELGWSPVGSEAVSMAPLPTGEIGYSLSAADDTTSAVFATALEELLSPMSSPRYVIDRPVTLPADGPGAVLRWAGSGFRLHPDAQAWHALPSAFAQHRAEADVFADWWRRWLGGGPALFAGNPEAAGVIAATRGQDPFRVTCVLRRVWS